MVNLEIDRVSVRFALKGATVEAVNDVSLTLRPGECVALVGESGCGKTVLASALLGFLPGNAETSGSARLGDVDLLAASDHELATTVRGRRIGLIPQSPASHLTPVRTARSQLEEAARVLGGDAEKAAERAGLLPEHLDRYPHELSGGMAQRVANALALVGNPPLLIADEPTTGLDRDLVDGLLDEFRRLVDDGHAVLLITHDLAAAHKVADRIAVMYAGRIVEVGPAHEVLDNSKHPYARGLANALPERDFLPIPGQPPLLTDLPAGCAFAPRCEQATEICEDRPVLTDDPHAVACHRPC
ncbi:ABC transporter ATP-binding protein [Lentzea pudingi]|uniref:Nickel import system ATP-binding protein NikD n=1 Tax=Lentzea pudingi TaxID=1789439 RepID=A0ABQ2HAM5_9PSEU|nr:ABC transporter ATP-binding protein [Lentzea pudingi]GGM71237.1 ABC transporter ATP-binding protein [Lentzea pudingi]